VPSQGHYDDGNYGDYSYRSVNPNSEEEEGADHSAANSMQALATVQPTKQLYAFS
jgi:hypothetical protein